MDDYPHNFHSEGIFKYIIALICTFLFVVACRNEPDGDDLYTATDISINDYITTNGELTSTADVEHSDVKGNIAKLQYLFESSMPSHHAQYQFDNNKALLQKYLFLTRWRTFDTVALNRILPTEDFDEEVRQKRLNEEMQSFHKNSTSSLILWAICQNDNSSEWLKLFDATHFNESMAIRDIYTSKLNVKD